MDAQYPDATEEDVGRLGDRVCIICREEMVVRGSGRGRQADTDAEAIRAEGEGQGQAGQTEGEAVRTEQGVEGGIDGNTNPAQPPLPDEDGPNETPKKLVCGHVFHFHCLRSWLERQQSCPTWYVFPPLPP